MATNRSSLSWLILVLALAIPGFLFYNWWSRMDRARKHDLNVKVRTRLGGDTPFAGGTAPKNKLTNPMAASELSPASPAAAALPAQPGASAMPATPATPSTTQPDAPAQAEAPTQIPAAPAPELGPLPAAPAEAASVSPAEPKRDPTLSPYDFVRIERKLLEEQIRLREIEDAANRKVRKRLPPKDPDPATLVELQGIIETQDGNKAIVNGDMVTEGDLVGKVKILKITSQGVVFGFKKIRFTKSVNK